jgi:DNA-3-methyladenine glycosylase I
MNDVVAGADGLVRCRWAGATPEYASYHDTEWGQPEGRDDRLYEKLCLEGFQSGLSWLTILRKRDNFREAFRGFSIPAVAAFSEADTARLLADAGIVRHRGKIEAAIANARAALDVEAAEGSLAALVWRFEPAPRAAPRTFADLQSTTAESVALAKALRRYGFRFVGPTTVYAAMQAMGLVNDHLAGCFARDAVEAARAAFSRPRPAAD